MITKSVVCINYKVQKLHFSIKRLLTGKLIKLLEIYSEYFGLRSPAKELRYSLCGFLCQQIVTIIPRTGKSTKVSADTMTFKYSTF